MEKEKPSNKFNGVSVDIVNYTPNLDENDVNNLVNFIVELFCAKNSSEVQNG